ncbi:unnamed protein product [Paramecium pentaurelia]|uniref:WD40-repeat-containing domain n=1 Tax=Paramecium pentaurelia TaxID=43138 RepID=A0A8S1SPH7_9CILI|nr:unnamed protein product [Paramecium pentaurelia]
MNRESIAAELQNKVDECLQGFQQYLDSSFNRIDAFLDQLPLVPQAPIPQNTLKIIPPLPQLSLPSIHTIANQVIQEVKPIINLYIQKQIKYNQQVTLLQIQEQQKQQNIIINNDYQLNSKPFTYNLLQDNSIKQGELCLAIAINKDNSMVLATCDKQIKVFEFKQEQLKQTQLLSEHSSNVRTLNFMKKQSQFISSGGGQIIIWSMNPNSQWICSQKLNEHTTYINSLVMNNNEDVIISGSDDKTIKFWQKQQQWVCSQTITDHTNDVCGLSLNDQQNRVISCGKDKLILIIERAALDQKWNVIQKISVEVYGYRLYFINDNEFTFQPEGKEQMYVYEMNGTNKQYSKKKEIAVQSGYNGCHYHFPQQYIKKKCLLVNKNGYNVNLIRKNLNSDFITQQSIQFGHEYIFGQMSEDGEYLMTWDRKSQEIQIRKYHQE